MTIPLVVLVVGHAHWGKSLTLRELTHGNFRQNRYTVSSTEFFIRRMSNDDDPQSYINFVRNLSPVYRPHLLATFCPSFHVETARAQFVLDTFKQKNYQIYSFVLEHQYGTNEVVTQEEVKRLREYGKVEVYSGQSEATTRARVLQSFLTEVITVE